MNYVEMDIDQCIIFVKGLKPVKADKYYYFKHPMAKELERHEISHNDIGEIQRGTWRKYNPYNPYVPEDEEKKVENLKVESLDDLFEDDEEVSEIKKEEPKKEVVAEKKNAEVVIPDLEEMDEKVPVGVTNSNMVSLDDFEADDAPVLPQDDEYDLQKELEAKFDELFGPIDDDN